MDITDAVLDTNTLYRPRELREIASRGTVRLWGSVANVVEIVGDIVDAGTFAESRSQLRTLEEVAPRGYLPDTDTAFKHDMGLQVSLADAAMWKEQVVKQVLEADSVEKLTLNLDLHRQRRQEHADAFDAGVKEMIKSINPAAVFEGENWKVQLKGADLATFLTWLWSPEGKQNLVGAWFSRQGWSNVEIPRDTWKRAFMVLDPYYRAYRGYVKEIISRNIRHQKNDALDFDFLVSLWRTGWVFVTQEKRVKQFLAAGELDASKYVTVEQLLGHSG